MNAHDWPAPTGQAPGGWLDEKCDLAACRERLRHGSRTFLAASYLLPATVRASACALYAFCRQADDEVDNQVDGHRAGAAVPALRSDDAVAALRLRLAAVYRGHPSPEASDRALARVVRAFAIPATLPLALIEGFEWDAQGRRYETLDELEAYAARVAGTVGAMMSLLMGTRHPGALARACDMGVAMQLSNIARDVGEDAREGRIYLPLAWLREAGIEPEAWLARPVHSPALAAVVARLLARADELYRRAEAGMAVLPADCRAGIHAAATLYAAIGHQVARDGLNPLAGRASVPGWRKAWLLTRATLRASIGPGFGNPAVLNEPPLAATRFLVEAVAGSADPARPPGAIEVRVQWLFELFERLGKVERGAAGAERAV